MVQRDPLERQQMNLLSLHKVNSRKVGRNSLIFKIIWIKIEREKK